MSKINQIQSALKEIDGGKFQKLCDSYLKQKGYHNLNPLGSVLGADKVRKGTPDTTVRQEDGRLIFVEYTTTTQKNVADKLQADLRNCLNESKTGVPVSDISEVIFCHTSTLTAEEENKLYKMGENSGIKVDMNGITSISFDLYRNYPGLAKDFFGISIDSGQILPPEEFVESYNKNKYSTPLDTVFQFRESEIKEALEKLESHNLLLVSGPAGVGKSRLALEIIRQFNILNPDYKTYCVRDRGQDLFEDLKVYFSSPGSYLIFVDDANRIGKFDYIIYMLQDKRPDQNIKVIATVRDYALNKIKHLSDQLGNEYVFNIDTFDRHQIKELVKKQYNITNPLWLERIATIAKGNPRLAIMSSKVVVKDDNLNSISDVSSLYDLYFSSIREDLKELEDESILKVAGIISLFRNVDKTNEELMSMIHSVFDIDAQTFWDVAKRLHDYELVDMYENVVVKISDQVLATYMFYLAVFKSKVLSIKVIINELFPGQINRIQDALYPCLNSFTLNRLVEQIRPVVSELWKSYDESGNKENLHQLIKTFWFMQQTDTLSYIHECIDNMEVEQVEFDALNWEESNNVPDTNLLLSLLELFSQAKDKEFHLAVEMTFRYMEKQPHIIPNVLRLLSKSFGFDRYSHWQDYRRQHFIINHLISQTQQGTHLLYSKLFVAVCKKYLKTQFEETESSGRSFTVHRFKLLPVSAIFKLRGEIWDHIFKLFKIPVLENDVIDLLKQYCGSGFYINVKEIAEKDSEKLVPFMSSTLNPDNISHCLLVQKYIEFRDRRHLESLEELKDKFNSKPYQTYNQLSYNYSLRPEGMEISDFDQFKREQISEFTKNYDLKAYKDLLHYCIEIKKEISDNHEAHQLMQGLCQLFSMLADKDLNLFTMVIRYYLSLGEPFRLICNVLLVEKLIMANGTDAALSLIENENYPAKRHWEFAYHQALTSEQVTPKDMERLYELYETSELSELPYDYEYLLKFQNQNPSVVIKVTEILLKRSFEDEKYGNSFKDMFNPFSEINKNLMSIFKGKIDVLKKAYLAHTKVEHHADYDGNTMNLIINEDSNFILEYLDQLYEDKDYISRYDDSRDYSFLWGRDDVSDVMISVIDKILQNEKKRGYFIGGHLESYFCIDGNRVLSPDIISKQDDFLLRLIENNAHDSDIMKLVFSTTARFEQDRRTKFTATFLKENKDIKDFEELPLEPMSWSWSGSAVPVIDGRISFWESLLPLCDSVDVLRHKKYIEKNIQNLQKALEQEKKSDFMND